MNLAHSQGTAGEEFNDPLPQLPGEPGIKLSFPLDGPLSVAAHLSPLSCPGTENAARMYEGPSLSEAAWTVTASGS